MTFDLIISTDNFRVKLTGELREVFFDLLYQIDEACRKSNIQYFIIHPKYLLTNYNYTYHI